MSFPLLFQGLGSIGIFASRAFLPAFVTALTLRFGPEAPWIGRLGLLPQVRDMPTWFTSDAALIVLGLLAALELAAERSDDAREILHEVHGYLKGGMAALTYLGVLKATDRAAIAPIMHQAGFFDVVPAVAVGAGTWFVAQVRGSILRPLHEVDEDDDLGFRRLLRWVGDLWGALGPVALILLPLVTVGVLGVATLMAIGIERWAVARAGRAEVACPHCGRGIHPSAPTCPSCRMANPAPRGIGVLGLAKETPADPEALPFQLVAVKRCPGCAARLDRRAVHQTCRSCGRELMADPAFARAYIAAIDRRVPVVCLIGFGLGLVPVLGVIPGVIAYRLGIVAPYRRYIPSGQNFLLRWGVRLAVVVLVALQWIPVAGGLALPAMGLISYAAYRSAYSKRALAA